MTCAADQSPGDDLSLLWQAASDGYARETGITVTDGAFPKLLRLEDLSSQLDAEKDQFQDFRTKKRTLLHVMQLILAPFENWGDLVGGVVAAAFPPASSIMGAMLLLIRGARKVSQSFDMIIDLFQRLSNFALRLNVYKDVPLNEGMKVLIVKILVVFLRVCAASHKLLAAGSVRARLSKWVKNVFLEDPSITSLMAELEELTSQEHKMISAQNLSLTTQTLKNTANLLKRGEDRNERERLDKLKEMLRPVSASSQVHSAISETRIPGSGHWIEDKLQSWWQSSQPLLWLHGGPGVGKSYLASKVINDLAKSELLIPCPAVVAHFYCKNNDVDLRSLNKGLRTLAWHVATQLPSFAVHAEDFCLKRDPANTYAVWRELIHRFFNEVEPGVSVCFVIDGIDEADPDEQEVLFSLLEKSYATIQETREYSHIRFVLLGRDSVGVSFEEHSLDWVADIEITNSQNKEDLYVYISKKLQRASLFRGSSEFLNEVVSGIHESAEGLWEWANLVLSSVLRCRTKGQIRQVIKKMPRGISAMLTQELERLARDLAAVDMLPDDLSEISVVDGMDGEVIITQVQQLKLLLSLVTVAERPLTVEQLELMLEILLDDEILNLENDLRTIYSSLFSLRRAGNKEGYLEDDCIVALRHSSFYEFFKASGQRDTGPIHVDLGLAEASILLVSLFSFRKSYSPKSKTSLGPVMVYAEDFLLQHMTRTSPIQAGDLHGRISTLLTDLFSKEKGGYFPFISTIYDRTVLMYKYFPSSRVGPFASYWFGAEDKDLANERAQLVLDWLLPASREVFEVCARSSTVVSDLCPFTVLFSAMAISLARHWLDPNQIDAHDGHAWAIPVMLSVYGEMAGTMDLSSWYGRADDPETDCSKQLLPAYTHLPEWGILAVAELQQFQKTATWHARLGQALVLHGYPKMAIDQFQKALSANEKTQTFSKQSLSVIYGDMSRAYFDDGLYKEALEHSYRAESLNGPGRMDGFLDNPVGQLLNIAQMKYLGDQQDQAVAAAHEAWELYKGSVNNCIWDLWADFVAIFTELRQPSYLRTVFNFALGYYEEFSRLGNETDGDALSWIELAFDHPSTMYKAINLGLTPDDEQCLRFVAYFVERLTESKYHFMDVAKAKCLMGSVLFEKAQFGAGIRSWLDVVSLPQPPSTSYWQIKPSQKRSLSHLAAVCLYHPEIPFPEETAPLALDEDALFSDVCLVISSWLRDRGDIENAREVLRGRVKKCIAWLSDDTPSSDGDVWVSLFKTFLIAPESDEDLSVALYMTKAGRRTLGVEVPKPDTGVEPEPTEAFGRMRLEDGKTFEQNDGEKGDELKWNGVWDSLDTLTKCTNCQIEVGCMSYWYFCRSCPNTALCARCYPKIQSNSSDAATMPQLAPLTCKAQHEFYYSGRPLMSSECVEQGMVRLANTTSEGQAETITIEEWKDRLEERWETKNFRFEGGLSALCIEVLPEVQRSRWATFFKV